jgi:hypothetical protein
MRIRTSLLALTSCAAAVVSIATLSPAQAETRYGQANRPGTTHIGSLYQYAGKQGDQLYITAATGCQTSETSGDPEFYVTNLANSPYLSNNGTSSFADFASCDTKLFDGINGTGTTFGYYNATSAGMNVSGSFDNKASSVQWD